ncbi:MAG: hypothetical protein IID05_11730, partial [Gemmatimonadetes bacterium]|nr:hypothetical protein [Gemmatimonadota bacterium]
EEDGTLTDRVAGLRAATPSAAAEAVVPDRREVSRAVDALARRRGQSLTNRTQIGAERLERTADRLHGAMQGQIERCAGRLTTLTAKLDALSPLKVLQRGYAVVRDESGRVLKSVGSFQPDMDLRVTVTDGDVDARVVGIRQ